MRNRDYKEISMGSLVHVYNRGNNKDNIFIDDQDHKAFLFRLGMVMGFDVNDLNKNSLLSMPNSRIRINGNKNLYKIHSFCLMPNHFHLIIEQLEEESISTMMLKLCTSYSKYFNKKYNRVGHVFQDQFKANVILDDKQMMWTSAYIHTNPIKDGFVRKTEKYVWSSYIDFTENRNLPLVTKDLLLGLFGDKKSFIKETFTLSNVKGAL